MRAAMANSDTHTSPLHHCHIHKLRAYLYRAHFLVHMLALVAIFYYRATFFLNKTSFAYYAVPFLPWLLMFGAELLYAFIWFLKQPFYWWPVTRTVFPERLPKDDVLPAIDVFICTTDPKKEPTFEVMNTVISAMSLDYPADKLSVYLSDDGAASVTLYAIKEAWVFATWWLPFCKKYSVKTICPRAYFKQPESDPPEPVHDPESKEASRRSEFIEDRNIVQDKYEAFKSRVRSKSGSGEIDGGFKTSAQDHSSFVQVINRSSIEDDTATAIINPEHVVMPSVVYVAREKRPSHPHNFKAGALNVLLRVSAMLSNSHYILVLDCDMYCNDSKSARQAMCFYLDPKISPTLGWVQYPQTYYNVNENDIYDSRMRFLWNVYWLGADGLQGPVISGTNFYINRKALYGFSIYNGNDIKEPRDIYGFSNELIKSLSRHDMPKEIEHRELCSVSVKEAQFLASCAYEENTKWGEKVGFRYESVVEDAMTGYMLQSKGWRSVYLKPSRPQFLGAGTINLNELLIQNTRWTSGLVQIGLSKYCPLIYSPSRMHILHRISSSWVTLYPLGFISVWCFTTIPLISFLFGVPLYPKVSDTFFAVFAFVFISSLLKLLCEVIVTGGSVRTWLNEQRIWKIKWLAIYAYGVLDSVLTNFRLRKASFIPTNKAEDNDTVRLYEKGKFDFRTSNMFLVPLVTVVSLNLCCFVGGVARLTAVGNWDTMFAQAVLSFYGLIMSFPVMDAMLLRRDNGCIPLSTTLTSTMTALVLLSFGHLILLR